MPVQFTVVPVVPDRVVVQFDQRLGPLLRHGAYDVLGRVLDYVEGVSHVEMNRYSYTVTVALHVRSLLEVTHDIIVALSDDPELYYELLKHFDGHEVVTAPK
jgi:hypothetical protein